MIYMDGIYDKWHIARRSVYRNRSGQLQTFSKIDLRLLHTLIIIIYILKQLICYILQQFAKICKFLPINYKVSYFCINSVSQQLGLGVSIVTCHLGGPSSIPYQSKPFFSPNIAFDYVVRLRLTSSLRISERENLQIQELAPCGASNILAQ